MGTMADEEPMVPADESRTDPLVQLSLAQLRLRSSIKWRAYPQDVLPLWVAEMDVLLAPPIAEALHRAIDLGDTGYPHGTAYAEALAGFAARVWQWDSLRVEHTAAVTDVILTSASKAWNLPGLKSALAIAGPESAADLRRMPQEAGTGRSHLGVLAHTVALNEGGAWLEDLLGGLDANRRLLGELIARHLPGAGYRPPQGTYLAWLDFTALGLEAERHETPGVPGELVGPAALFCKRARVALNSGHAFGAGGAGCVWLNFATSPAVLRQALAAMGRAVAEL